MGLFPVFSKDDIWKPIIGLILNLIFPGIGTLVCAFLGQGGTHTTTVMVGIIQCLLYFGGYIVGTVLLVVYIGAFVYIAIIIAWIWALIWSIMMIVSSTNNNGPTTVVVTTSNPQQQQQQPVYYAPQQQPVYYTPQQQPPQQASYYQPPQPQYYVDQTYAAPPPVMYQGDQGEYGVQAPQTMSTVQAEPVQPPVDLAQQQEQMPLGDQIPKFSTD